MKRLPKANTRTNPALPPEIDTDALTLVPVEETYLSESQMEQLGLDVADYGDFLVAYKIIGIMSEGVSLAAAAKSVGMNRQTVSDEHWQRLITKAMRTIIGHSALAARTHIMVALDAFPAAVRRVAHIAQFAERDQDAIAATELLKTIVDNVPEFSVDATDQSKYLKGHHNYQPMKPLILAQQITNNYNMQPTDDPESKSPPDDAIEGDVIVEVEASEPQSDTAQIPATDQPGESSDHMQ